MKYLSILLFIFLGHSLSAQSSIDETHGKLLVKVTDYSNKIRVGEEISFYGISTKKTFSGISDAKGTFEIRLPKGDTYRILISSIGEHQEYSTVKVPNEPGLYGGELTVLFELPSQITLKDVLYESGSAKLTASSYKPLDELAAFMKRKTSMVIEIAGHTDNVGSEENNLTLSQKRAESVKKYLIAKGIAADRVTAKGYGQNEPVANNDTETGRKQNRRTEVRIIKE